MFRSALWSAAGEATLASAGAASEGAEAEGAEQESERRKACGASGGEEALPRLLHLADSFGHAWRTAVHLLSWWKGAGEEAKATKTEEEEEAGKREGDTGAIIGPHGMAGLECWREGSAGCFQVGDAGGVPCALVPS